MEVDLVIGDEPSVGHGDIVWTEPARHRYVELATVAELKGYLDCVLTK